jgi:GT2 family glycosyltransferase
MGGVKIYVNDLYSQPGQPGRSVQFRRDSCGYHGLNPMQSLAFAIISYNTREHLRACLQSIEPGCRPGVLVVDNASSDGSPEMVRSEFPEVSLLANEHNPGYGAAANQAIYACNAHYVLLLNSDTRLQPRVEEKLFDYLEHNRQAAIVGPRLLNADGSLQISTFPFPTPFATLVRETVAGRVLGATPWVKERYLPTWSHDRPRPVPWVMGAAMAIRKSAFREVGGFDESFFMYYEEIDLCYRAWQSGWEVHFAPVSEVVHIREASTSQQRLDMIAELYASMGKFYRRHYSLGSLVRLKGVLAYIMWRNTLRDRLRLARAGDPQQRRQLQDDLAAWRRVAGRVLSL